MSQHSREIDRLHETGLYWRTRPIVSKEVRVLGDLVIVVKRHVQRQGADKTELFPVALTPQALTHIRRRKQPSTHSRLR